MHGALLAMRSTLGGDRHGALPVQRLAPMLDHDPQRASQAALLLARLGYVTRFVSIGEPGASREAPATRRSRMALRWARRWSAASHAESIWSERWAWADDPRTMTALFEEIWQPGGQAPAREAVRGTVLDEPLVDGARAESAPAGGV